MVAALGKQVIGILAGEPLQGVSDAFS